MAKTFVKFEEWDGKSATVKVPRWDAEAELDLPLSRLPSRILNALKAATPPFRCRADVNLDAPDVERLGFSDWELA